MSDDYLWDKTGEPDPQIQQLEQVLGTLRYEPRALEIPAAEPSAPQASSMRHVWPRFAIAATIAMMLLAGGLWLAWQRSSRTQIARAPAGVSNGPTGSFTRDRDKTATGNVLENRNTAVSPAVPNRNPVVKSVSHSSSEGRSARGAERLRRPTITVTNPGVDELREAEAAKVQLMLAFRVASAKLSFAQKKTQGTNPENVIHNQHKIG